MTWKFDCFKEFENQEEPEVIKWLAGLSIKAKQNLKRSLQILSNQAIQEWSKPSPSSKIKGFNHIYVIRFKDENRTQWRIYGFHDVKRGVFMMTNYGTEKDDTYKPPVSKCGKLATERMELCYQCWNKHAFYGSDLSNEHGVTTDKKLLG